MILVTAAEMRELDRLTIERYSVLGLALMERAGAGATRMLLEVFPHVRKGRVVVVCGKGNNGGDGFVIARLLRGKRIAVDCFLLGRRGDLKGDAKLTCTAYVRAGGRVIELNDRRPVGVLIAALGKASLVVDAIFGTGLNAPVKGTIAEVIHTINASGVPTFAVDMPSGLDSDRGAILGTAIQAEATATFGFPKLGQVVYPGLNYVGALGVVDIGIATGAIAEVEPKQRLLETWSVARSIPRRMPEAHKGSCGHVAIFAGSLGHTGAAMMCSHAACRIGAGLTTLIGPASLNGIFALGRPEVMTTPLQDKRGLVTFNRREIDAALKGRNAAVVGPGMGTHPDAVKLVTKLCDKGDLPLVLDADALTNLGRKPARLGARTVPAILTPHPGEMSRLLGKSVAEVQADRTEVARSFAVKHRCVVVLKGARTVIAAPSGEVSINPTGNPGMASGGMGDALAGMIGGLLAQGLAPYEAACLAVYLHGEIADHIAAEQGQIGMLASDVIEGIPRGIGRLLNAANSAAK